MSRNRASTTLSFVGLSAVVIAAGVAIGYYGFGGMHTSQPVSDAPAIQESAAPVSAPSPAPTAPVTIRPERSSSNYTAPGAPRIHILEDKNAPLDSSPSPHAVHHRNDNADTTDIPTPDVEASQEGTDTSRDTPDGTIPAVKSPDTTSSNDQSAPPDAGSGTPNSTPSPTTAPAQNSAQAGKALDSEASQTGDKGGTSKATQGRAQYRVQAGSFANADNAKDYVKALHSQGMDANLQTEQQGDKTVYKVQVGAFRNRADADQAAAGYRQKGVPVTVSPITP